MNERLPLGLPHRQFVFTVPRIWGPYFRHNRRLFSEISRLIFATIQHFYIKAANRPIKTGIVLAYQRAGEFFRFNPHWHAIVLEGGFDKAGGFVAYPPREPQQDVVQFLRCRNCLADWLQPICTSTFRRLIIKFFLEEQLISARLATIPFT